MGSQGEALEMRHTDSGQKTEWDKASGQKGTFEERSEIVYFDPLQVWLKWSGEGERKGRKQAVNLMGLVSLWMSVRASEFEDFLKICGSQLFLCL